MKKQGKITSLLLAMVLILSFSLSPIGASADTAYNTTLQPGQSKVIAQEYIIGGGSVQGTQQNVYAGNNRGVQYIITDNNGTIIKQETKYTIEVHITFDAGFFGKTVKVLAKNVYNGVRDAVRLIGSLKD